MSNLIVPNQRKIALCIGSGGPKPFAAFPLIKFLRQHEIEIEFVSGCSGGSIVSGALGAGFSNNELDFFVNDFNDEIHLRKLFKRVDFKTILGVAHYPFGRINVHTGILKVEQLKEFYIKYFGEKQLQDLDTKTYILATNYITGEPCLLSDGPLHSAIMGSSSMYPIMPVIQHNDLLICDGGFNCDIPLMDTVKRASGPIIALTFSENVSSSYRSFLDFYVQFVVNQAHLHTKDHIPMAINLHHSEILFLNYHFDEEISLNTAGSLEKVMKKGDDMVRKYGREILGLFGT